MRLARRSPARRWTGSAPLLAGAAVFALALGAAACGGGNEEGNDAPDPFAGKGTLIVSQIFGGDSVYIEGSIPFLRIVRDGDIVLRDPRATSTEALVEAAGEDPLLRRQLDAGEYTLVSYQRPCSGNCGALDPPTDRCEADFELDADEQLEALVGVRPGEGCTIEFESRGHE